MKIDIYTRYIFEYVRITILPSCKPHVLSHFQPYRIAKSLTFILEETPTKPTLILEAKNLRNKYVRDFVQIQEYGRRQVNHLCLVAVFQTTTLKFKKKKMGENLIY